MKKLFLLSILASTINFNCISQTKLPNIKTDKFAWEEKDQNKTYTVAFKYFIKDVEIPQDRLNTIIMNAIIKSKYKLKNMLSFRPIEVNIYNSDSDLNIFVKYAGKNAYGVESLSQSYFIFKNEGDGNVDHLFTN